MRKIVSLFLILCLALGLTACGGNTAEQAEQTQTAEVQYDQQLLDAMSSWIVTAQPGTAGSGFKAAYAAQEMLAWAETSSASDAVIIATVDQFFASCENEAEALETFQNIAFVFETLNSDQAEAFLEQTALTVEDFAMTDEVSAKINCLLDAAAQYTA